ncbi:MAG: OmpA family protein [Deltaproteobacteria bacterium]|nr:OmpA family protein [Deltaproteobacteria bacterium]
MNIKTKNMIAGLALAGTFGGCASVVPAQLVEARAVYSTSSNGLASKMTPTELYEAKKALDQANGEFTAHGDTLAVRDYSYIAKRKTELADVKARTELDRERIAEAARQGVVVRDNQVKTSQIALARSRDQLRDERHANYVEKTELRAANAAQGSELEGTAARLENERNAHQLATTQLQATNTAQGKELEKAGATLEAERQARMAAETRLAGAMKDLATIAAVKEEARGVVITLSGSVLFASGRYTLLETAKTKLDHVAQALKAQGDDRTMLVEGHTDSQGSVASNMTLSLNRASGVRDYLLTRGVAANKIAAVGLGSSRPLLDNSNAENRANNRRVEIIIQPSRLTAR